jgi:hypothetical protein
VIAWNDTRIDDSWLLHKSLSRSDKAGNFQYPLDLIEASKRLLETSKALKDTDACGQYLDPMI